MRCEQPLLAAPMGAAALFIAPMVTFPLFLWRIKNSDTDSEVQQTTTAANKDTGQNGGCLLQRCITSPVQGSVRSGEPPQHNCSVITGSPVPVLGCDARVRWITRLLRLCSGTLSGVIEMFRQISRVSKGFVVPVKVLEHRLGPDWGRWVRRSQKFPSLQTETAESDVKLHWFSMLGSS